MTWVYLLSIDVGGKLAVGVGDNEHLFWHVAVVLNLIGGCCELIILFFNHRCVQDKKITTPANLQLFPMCDKFQSTSLQHPTIPYRNRKFLVSIRFRWHSFNANDFSAGTWTMRLCYLTTATSPTLQHNMPSSKCTTKRRLLTIQMLMPLLQNLDPYYTWDLENCALQTFYPGSCKHPCLRISILVRWH